jgi:undecaprenyl diphosphate synthase
MNLLRSYLSDAFSNPEDGVKVVVIGDREPLADDIKQQIVKLEEESVKSETVMTLNIALNYGGRLELVQAVQKITDMVKEGKIDTSDISEQLISDMIYTAGQPDPDLIIRPSGEFRTSNFLLWQSAYSELVFMDVLWPDFTKEDLVQAIIQYQKRNRRFGGV